MHVPVLNIPREDVRIRPELLQLLPYAGIEEDSLITVDDVFPPSSSAASLEPGTAAVTLVDHNKPTVQFSFFVTDMEGCVDHHINEHALPKSADPRVITLDAGSCTSLVISHIRPSWDALSMSASSFGASNAQDDTIDAFEDEAMRRGWDAQVAKFALAAVLIDTNNLEDPHKTRDMDREAVEYLLARIDLAPPGKIGGVFSRDNFFEVIKAAKSDLSDLSFRQVLRKDYKEFEVGEKKLGMSSSVKSIAWVAGKAAEESSEGGSVLVKAIQEWREERKLDVFAIMTAATHWPQEEFRKEILVWPGPRGHENLPKGWQEVLNRECRLGPLEGEVRIASTDEVCAWREHDLSKSRKQVAPILRGLMEDAQRA